MTRTIKIDPVTRIEGHAKVFINLDDGGQLASAGLVVNELRGFERILVGMAAEQMPLVTARVCGVCPTAHHLAAANALDAACGVEAPPAAKLLRELMYMGHIIHSHSLSLFLLQGPDLVMGLDADPATRNIVGVVQASPEVAKKALRCRSLGQKINELVGGRGVHPVTAVAGGITFDLDEGRHKTLISWAEELLLLLEDLVPLTRTLMMNQIEKHPVLMSEWTVPAWSMGTVKDGLIALNEGILRVVDREGNLRREFHVRDYEQHLVETVVDHSYIKGVRIKEGDLRHDYRVGPLARINAIGRYGTPRADRELERFLEVGGRPCHNVIMQTYARLIELLWSVERARQILDDPRIHGETRVPARFPGGRGVGHVEAPRGTLIHDYEIDEQGIVRAANLIVATQQNQSSIDLAVTKAAQNYVVGRPDDAMLLNAVEFAVRCFDPCLACASHALGAMPMEIQIRRGGDVMRTVRRGA